jgi:hypothetical protein
VGSTALRRGYSLIYRLTGIVHFAFGDLVGLGIFTTLLVLAGTTPVSQAGAHEPQFLLALIVGLAVCVLAGAATYVGLVQPYLSRGLDDRLGRRHAAGRLRDPARDRADFQRSSYVFPDPLPFHRVGTAGYIHVGGAQVQARRSSSPGSRSRSRSGRPGSSSTRATAARCARSPTIGGRARGRRAGRAARDARVRAGRALAMLAASPRRPARPSTPTPARCSG